MKICDASPLSDLAWDPSPDSDGTYEIDFGFKAIDPFDLATFNQHLLAVEEFAKTFPEAGRVVMARLDGDFASLITQNETFEQQLEESGLGLDLFCVQLFSDYLHHLASALPDSAEPAVVVSLKEGLDRAAMILTFCKRRFEHFTLLFEGESLPISGTQERVVSLPQDDRFDAAFFSEFLKGLVSYKCIPEELLNEHWDEAAEIIYDSETIGDLGNRMLLGFEAAGGVIKKAR